VQVQARPARRTVAAAILKHPPSLFVAALLQVCFGKVKPEAKRRLLRL